MLEVSYEQNIIKKELESILKRYLEKCKVDFNILYLKEYDKKGYKIVSKDGSCTIYYNCKSSLGRAVFVAGNKKGNYSIEDSCSFDNFTVMVDMARNAVMKVKTIKDLINEMFLMGYNCLGLYLEDVLMVENEPYFGYMRGAYSKEEIREIVNYGNIFGIETVPYIQTLAHLNQITRYEHYQKFVDCDDILLADDESTYKFLDNYIKQVKECFDSKRVNIGMDEAHMVGLGKYLDRHGYEKRTDIIQKHLKKVMEITEKYDLNPEMWSDMFFRLVFNGEYTGDIKKVKDSFNIPENLKLVYWDYYSTDYKHYDEKIKQHLVLSNNFAMASGAWRWTGFVPHNKYSFNILSASQKAMKENCCKDYIITMWGDDGAECSVFSLLPALFYGSNLAYGKKVNEEAFKVITGYSPEEYIEIDKLNPIQKDTTHNNLSKIWFYDNLLIGTFQNTSKENFEEYYKNLSSRLDALGKRDSKYNYLFKTYSSLSKVLEIKTNIGNKIRELYELELPIEQKKETIDFIINRLYELKHRLINFIKDFKYQWYLENKFFGYEVQSIRQNGLLGTINDTIELLTDYSNGKISTIDALEEKQLPFSYFSNYELESLSYNLWRDISSPSKF